jgi:hypothetical protein
MDPPQALQEARTQGDQERAWRAFLCDARRILETARRARGGLLDVITPRLQATTAR